MQLGRLYERYFLDFFSDSLLAFWVAGWHAGQEKGGRRPGYMAYAFRGTAKDMGSSPNRGSMWSR